jgi:uncharacterized damage-inducible protein DinB
LQNETESQAGLVSIREDCAHPSDRTFQDTKGDGMKKFVLLTCAVVCFGPAVFAQALTQADREKGVKYLEQTRDAIVADTKGLTDAQWKWKPAPDRWSVAETLEHIALAEDLFFQMITEKVMKGPAGAADREIAKTDAGILAMVPDRSHKAQAPPELVPTGKWTPAETLDHFLKSRAKMIEYLKTTPDLREHVMASEMGKPLDAYQWILFNAAHSDRHDKQIKEVETTTGFPKK